MNITVPVDSLNEVLPLIHAGADEFYCGVYSQEWKKKNLFPNARHMSYANLRSFQELSRLIKICKSNEKKVFFCANEYYSQEGQKLILEDIEQALLLGIDGYIIADLTLVPYITRLNKRIKIVLSSLTPCFNTQTIVLCKKLGVSRIVLPLNQMSLMEIKKQVDFARSVGMEIEVFIGNGTSCKNVTGFCLYHRLGYDNLFKRSNAMRYKPWFTVFKAATFYLPYRIKSKIGQMFWSSKSDYFLPFISPCRKAYSLTVNDKYVGTEIKRLQNVAHEKDFARAYCAVCASYFFNKWGVAAGKIGGRGKLTGDKLKEVRFFRSLIDNIEQGHINSGNLEEKAGEMHKNKYGVSCDSRACFHGKPGALRGSV